MVCLQASVAFGLATYLLSAKWSPQRARQGLLLFAAASPVVAALTYLAIMAVPGLSSQVRCCQSYPYEQDISCMDYSRCLLEP